MARRRYSDEYKPEAVALTRVHGATIQAVAANLGINAHLLGKWRKAIEQHGKKAFPGPGHARGD
jgi:transposase